MPTEATVDIHAATIGCVKSFHKAPQGSKIDVQVCTGGRDDYACE